MSKQSMGMVGLGLIETHPDHIEMPMSSERFEALKADIERSGVCQPLLVVERKDKPGHYWLLGGHHRQRACEILGVAEAPIHVLPPESNAVDVMLADNATGRARTMSAVALMVYLYHQEALDAEDPDERQKGCLRRGNLPVRKNSSRENIGVSARFLGERYGFDYHYITLLIDLRRRMDDEQWEGVKRAILEGEISVQRITAGEGGKVQAGKKVEVKFGKLGGKAWTSVKTSFENWAKVAMDEREIVLARMQLACEVMPADAFGALAAAADKWPEHECKAMAKALKDRLAREQKA